MRFDEANALKVGIDARAVARGLGIATFITGLAEHVAAMPGREVILFGPPAGALPAAWPAALRPYPVLDSPLGRIAARRAGIDVMHFTANSGWTARGRTPFVLTVHDAIFLARDTARSPRQRAGHAYQRRNVRSAARAAAAVAAPSRAAADAVQAALGLPEPPRVIPNGVTLAAAPHTGARDSVVAFGGRDPRKRLDVAYAGWRRAGRPGRLLVLAGAGLPPGFDETAAEDIAAGRVRILGYQPRPELERLLGSALAVVYPSDDEGFGLPVIEAMAAGSPVITGACAATREIAGGAALDLGGEDPAERVAHWLERLQADPGLVERQVAAGRRQAEAFGWARCAQAYAALYDEAAG